MRREGFRVFSGLRSECGEMDAFFRRKARIAPAVTKIGKTRIAAKKALDSDSKICRNFKLPKAIETCGVGPIFLVLWQ